MLSSILVGVVVAVALLSSTPLYSNALNDLGLRHALAQQQIEQMDLDFYSSNNPIDRKEYDSTTAFVNSQVDNYLGSLIRQRETSIMAEGFDAMLAGQVIPTDSNRPRGYFQTYSNLEKHVKLVAGRFPVYAANVASPEESANLKGSSSRPAGTILPGDVTNPDFEIEALISPQSAALMNASVGDRLVFFTEGHGSDPVYINIRLVGFVEPIDPHDEFWFLKTDVFDVPQDDGIVIPLFIPEDTMFKALGAITPLTKISYHWYCYVDLTRVNSTQAKAIANAVDYVGSTVSTKITNVALFTNLDKTITEYLQKQLFTQIPLYLLVFQVAAIIFYYIITVANMVIDQQTGEIALLRSRGASTLQVFGIFLMEGLLISAFGGAVGPFLGAFVFGLLGKTGPFAPLTGGGLLPIRFSPSVFILAGVAALLCLTAFMFPAIQASRRGIVHYRQAMARPPRTPVWQRFYLDIVLLFIGGGLYYELKQRGSLLSQRIFGNLGVDPLLLVTPLLFMLAVAIVFLRLFPWLVSLASKLGRYITNSVIVLTFKYMARNPIHYSRLILLLMMAASVGMFSASFLGTLNRSYVERVAYAVGSDVRLDNPQDYGSTGKEAMTDRYSAIDGVNGVSLAYRGTATIGTFNQTDAAVLAVDPATFSRTAWYRQDFSAEPLPALMAKLSKDTPVVSGIPLPDGAQAIGIWIKPVYGPNPRVTLMARIEDGRGFFSDIALGSPQFDDWQYVEGSLYDSLGNLPVSPLRLRCLFLSFASGPVPSLQGMYLDNLQVVTDDGPVVVDGFESVSKWTPMYEFQNSPTGGLTAGSDSLTLEHNVVHDGSASARYSWGSRSGFRGIFPNVDANPLIGIASRSFLKSLGLSVGSLVTIRVPGQFMTVSIEDVVDYFPTLDPSQKPFLILNYDRLLNVGLGSNNRFYPNEVLLTLKPDSVSRSAAIAELKTSDFRADSLLVKDDLLAAQKSDPLVAAGWGGVLIIAFIGVVLVSGIGFVVYAYLSARGRHLEFAVLRTLGFSWRQIVSLVCFEQIFVIGLGMGIGTLLGNRLSRIMLPFLQLTEKGQAVVPPFVLVTDWRTVGIAYVILTFAFVATLSLVVIFFSRVALHRALRMGDQ